VRLIVGFGGGVDNESWGQTSTSSSSIVAADTICTSTANSD